MAEQEKKIIYQEAECYAAASPGGEAYLIGSKCRKCGYVTFPPRVACSACVSGGSMVTAPLGFRGKIDTFSVLHTGTSDFKAPYILAYVLIGGAKVLSLITGCEPQEESLEIGEEVELVIEKIREDGQGNEIWGYKFRPVGGGKGGKRIDGLPCAK
jgi:scaffold protein (connect acetoacetyl-CoA thiolase and HMG-CoA synthase)